jgi:hypothetical protein
MLLLPITLALTPPIAPDPLVSVDVAGMEPQIAIIRHGAAERGWRISCEGRSGEERVIRLVFPSGTDAATVVAALEGLGSSTLYYSVERPAPESCDQPEPRGEPASPPVRVLGIGPRDVIEPLVSVARACGFVGAALRDRRPDDLTPAAFGAHRDWLVMDAGEDAAARYGPLICWIQMQYRAMSSAATQDRSRIRR